MTVRKGIPKTAGRIGWEVKGKIYKTREEAERAEAREEPRPVARAVPVREEPKEELKAREVIAEKPPEGFVYRKTPEGKYQIVRRVGKPAEERRLFIEARVRAGREESERYEAYKEQQARISRGEMVAVTTPEGKFVVAPEQAELFKTGALVSPGVAAKLGLITPAEAVGKPEERYMVTPDVAKAIAGKVTRGARPEDVIAIAPEEMEEVEPGKFITTKPGWALTEILPSGIGLARRESKILEELGAPDWESMGYWQKEAWRIMTFWGPKGFEYITSHLPGGKKPEQIVKEYLGARTLIGEPTAEKVLGHAWESAIKGPAAVAYAAIGGYATKAFLTSQIAKGTLLGQTVAHPVGKGIMLTAMGTYVATSALEAKKQFEIGEFEKAGAEVLRTAGVIGGFYAGARMYKPTKPPLAEITGEVRGKAYAPEQMKVPEYAYDTAKAKIYAKLPSGKTTLVTGQVKGLSRLTHQWGEKFTSWLQTAKAEYTIIKPAKPRVVKWFGPGKAKVWIETKITEPLVSRAEVQRISKNWLKYFSVTQTKKTLSLDVAKMQRVASTVGEHIIEVKPTGKLPFKALGKEWWETQLLYLSQQARGRIKVGVETFRMARSSKPIEYYKVFKPSKPTVTTEPTPTALELARTTAGLAAKVTKPVTPSFTVGGVAFAAPAAGITAFTFESPLAQIYIPKEEIIPKPIVEQARIVLPKTETIRAEREEVALKTLVIPKQREMQKQILKTELRIPTKEKEAFKPSLTQIILPKEKRAFVQLQPMAQLFGQKQLQSLSQKQLQKQITRQITAPKITPTPFLPPSRLFGYTYPRGGYRPSRIRLRLERKRRFRRGRRARVLPVPDLWAMTRGFRKYKRVGIPRGPEVGRMFRKQMREKGVFMQFPTAPELKEYFRKRGKRRSKRGKKRRRRR